jgi:FkbM family methyltransferase
MYSMHMKSKKIVFYGAGDIAELWINSNPELTPEYFIEQNPTRQSHLGIKIVKPESIENKSDYIVLITVTTTKSQTFRNTKGFLFGIELVSNLKEHGYSEVYDLPEAAKMFFPNFLHGIAAGRYLWVNEAESPSRTVGEIDSVSKEYLSTFENNLFDQESKDVFNNLIQFRKFLNFDTYVFPDVLNKQYLDPMFWGFFNEKVRALDLGGFNGDSAQDILERYNEEIDFIVVAEPSLNNFEELLTFRNQLDDSKKSKVLPLLAAIGSSDEIVKIVGNGSSVRLSEANFIHQMPFESKIDFEISPMLKVDTNLTKLGINYIKMDIEGGEISALKSAKNYISNHTPFMAVAAYHKPDDLFKIPNLVLEFNNTYKFILRVYGHLLKETVIYCVPGNKIQKP